MKFRRYYASFLLAFSLLSLKPLYSMRNLLKTTTSIRSLVPRNLSNNIYSTKPSIAVPMTSTPTRDMVSARQNFIFCPKSSYEHHSSENTKSWWLGSALLGLMSVLSYSTYAYNTVDDELMPTAMAEEIAAEKICPVLRVEALLEECVYQVNNGRSFSSYIDEILKIVRAHTALFIERFPQFHIDKLVKDLESIRDSHSPLGIAWKLWNYWPLLPDSFWQLSTWERKKLIEQRLRY